MWVRIFALFQRHPDYFYISLGTLLSAIGMAVTSIAVYGELSAHNAEPVLYTFAFALEIVPAILASYFARRYFSIFNMAKLLFAIELIGGFCLLVPILGASTGTLPLILFAVSITSAVTGFMVPIHNTYLRRILNNDEMALVSVLSTYTFAFVFILGTLAGSVAYTYLGTKTYFLLDSLTYFLSCGLTLVAARIRPTAFSELSEEGQVVRFQFTKLTSKQKKAFLLNLILAFNCAPATALLPSLANRFGFQLDISGFIILPVFVFLILKTVGQILGPVVIQNADFDKLIANKFVVPFCLIVFHFCYLVIFNLQNLGWILTLVVIAHLVSNIVFILSFYALRRYFDEFNIGAASSIQHQLSIIIMATVSLLAGYLAQNWGYNLVAAFTFLGWLVYVILSLKVPRVDIVEASNG